MNVTRIVSSFSPFHADPARAPLGARLERVWPMLRWGLLGLAIAFSGVRAAYLPPWTPDHDKALAISKSLLAGDGYTLPTPLKSGLTKRSWPRSISIPPGYPIAASALIPHLSDDDDVRKSIEWFSILLFFAAWFVILEMSGVPIPVLARLWIWLVWAFAFDPLAPVTPAGQLGLAFLSTMMAAMIVGVKSDRRLYQFAFLAGAFGAAAAAVRYQYWPTVPVLAAAYVVLDGRITARNVKAALLAAGPAAIAVSGISLWQRLNWSVVTHVAPSQFGFAPERLLTMFPFLNDGVGGFDAINMLIGARHVDPFFGFESWVNWSLQWMLFAALLAVFLIEVRTELKMEGKREPSRRLFWIMGAIAVGATVLLLSGLSFRIQREAFPKVQERRLWAVTWPFVLAAAASFIVRPWSRLPARIGQCVFAAVLMLLFSGAFLHRLTGLIDAAGGRHPHVRRDVSNRRMLAAVKAEADEFIYLDHVSTKSAYHRIAYFQRHETPSLMLRGPALRFYSREPVNLAFAVSDDPEHPFADLARRASARRVWSDRFADIFVMTFEGAYRSPAAREPRNRKGAQD